MIPMVDLCIFSFGLSGCFWISYGLYVAVRIQWFIVKRYENETYFLFFNDVHGTPVDVSLGVELFP